MKSAQKLALILLSVWLGLAAASSRAWAATAPAFSLQFVEDLLAQAAPGQTTVYIGDMGFKVSYLQQLRATLGKKKTGASIASASPTGITQWPSGVVYYSYNGLTPTQQSQWLAACQEWEKYANVKFVQRTSETNYIRVNSSSDTNSSSVGRQGGVQDLYIVNWTWKYIICHEIAHALGFCHEQSRSDRDTYVSINSGNIKPGKEGNFSKLSTNNRTPYDFNSVMHYGPTDFSQNGANTITPKFGYESAAVNMGQRDYLSYYDKAGMVAMYGGPNLTFYQPSGWSGKIVVSTVTGANTDSASLTSSDTLYVDIAPVNSGPSVATDTWLIKYYVDDVQITSGSITKALNANTYFGDVVDKSIGSLTAGTHVVKVVIDAGNAIAETNEDDNVYQKTITVAQAGGAPTVETIGVNYITTNSAACGGNVTSDGGYSMRERGLIYSTDFNVVARGDGVKCLAIGIGTGAFGVNMVSLVPNTTYYVRAYAINSAGTSFGDTRSFTTLGVSVPDDHGNSIATATLINSNSTTAGSIETGGDNDYFRINLTSPGTLVLRTTGSTDTYGYLLNASGAELAYNDDVGAGNSNFQISMDVTEGTYYVRVRDYFSSDTGAYQLVASFTPVFVIEDFYTNPSSQGVPSSGGTYSFNLIASGSGNWSWGQSSGSSWVTTAEAASQSGSQVFSYTVAANTSTSSRSATITFFKGNMFSTHVITQQGMSVLSLSSPSLSAFSTGGNYSFDVNASGNWNWSLSYGSGSGWVTTSEAASQGSNQLFSFALAANTTTSTRSAIFTFTSGDLVATYTITQAGVPTLSASPVSQSPPAAGGSYSFEVSASSSWSWSQSSGSSWLTTAEAVNQSGNQTFSYSVAANTVASSRTATITLTSGTVTATHTITQAAVPALSVSSSAQSVPESGGSYSFNVTSSVSWSWSQSADSSWLTISEDGSQTGDQTFSYTAAANTSPNLRSATITLTSGALTATHTITQAGATVLSVSPANQVAVATSGSFNFNVTASGTWSWSQSAGSSWLTTAEAASQSGNQVFSYTLAANTDTSPRSATITLNSGPLTTTYTITQEALPSLTLSSSSQSIPAAGGSFSFNVLSSLTWSWGQSAGSAWVASSEAASQTGNQTFSYTVAANTNPTPRKAAIVLTSGNLTAIFLITQLGTQGGTGRVMAWGTDYNGNTGVPQSLGDVIAIATGSEHTLAVKSDGTVAAWGSETTVPPGLSNVTAVAGGWYHSLALKSDGTVLAWGRNNFYGETNVPEGLKGVIAIAAGSFHNVVLKSDGKVLAWGRNTEGQLSVPAGLSGVIAIDANGDNTVALKADGTVVAWGSNDSGQTSVPVGLNGVIAVAAGEGYAVALKADGTVVAWGRNNYGQTKVPVGLGGVCAISVGATHTLALEANGKVTVFGRFGDGGNLSIGGPYTGQIEGLNGVVAVAAGSYSTFVLTTGANLSFSPGRPSLTAVGGNYSISVNSTGNWNWFVNNHSTWITSSMAANQSGNQTLSYTVATNTSRSWRITYINFDNSDLYFGYPLFQPGEDHGNSTGDATYIGANSNTEGYIEYPGDNDYFRIDIGVPGTLTVRTTGSTDTFGYLLDSQGAEITQDNESGGQQNFQITQVVRKGAYYVQVKAAGSNGIGAYQLAASFTAAPLNLTFTQPDGWSDKVVVSKVPGTHADDSLIYCTDTLSVDFAPLNNGSFPLENGWVADILVDNATVNRVNFPETLNTGASLDNVLDKVIGPLRSGKHVITVVLDAFYNFSETDEQDNIFQKTITVVDPPSNNANLAGIVLSAGGLSPVFSGQTTSYETTVPYIHGPLNITATAAQADAMVRIEDTPGSKASATCVVPLHVGDNTVKIYTMAQDEVTARTYTLTVHRLPPVPEITVELPTDNPLVSDVSTITFPSADLGVSNTLTFNLRNSGKAELTGLTLNIDGDERAEFSTGVLVSQSLAPGGSQTFTVTATPSGLLARNAALRITSNDPDHGLFTVPLKAVGVIGVGFLQPTVVLHEDVGTVQIPIARTGMPNGAISMNVSMTYGSATAADVAPLESQMVSFADGDSIQYLNVTVIPDSIKEPNEEFNLTLSNPSDGVELRQAVATIRIADAEDDKKPALTVVSPAANANLPEGTLVLLSGKATDNNGVLKVQYSLNGGPFTETDSPPFHDSLSKDFEVVIEPAPGPNVLLIKSIDTNQRESAVVTRKFNYDVIRPLIVAVDGAGKVTAPFPGTDGNRKAGVTYTLNATPLPGQVFDGWTASVTEGTGITPALAELPKLTFKHQDGLILTAHFISNPFTAAIIGKFNGLVVPRGAGGEPVSTLATNDTTGLLSAVVNGTGAFTGTLKIGSLALPFAGVFDNAGIARFGATRAATLALAGPNKTVVTLALSLDMTGASNQITGTVKSDGTDLAVSALRAFYAPSNKVAEVLAGKSGKSYTLLFKHRTETQGNGLEPSMYPQGDGYATGTLKPDGSISFAGKLADNTVLTASAFLSRDNKWPLFSQLYASKKGCIAGLITVDDEPEDSDMRGGDVLWIRPATPGTQWYPDGWSTAILTDVLGSKYTPPPASIFPGLPAVDADHGNATLSFSGGLLLADPLSKDINISPANAATKAPKTDSSFTLNLTAASGLFSGSVNTGPTTKSNFQGVIFQKGTKPIGYGYFLSASPKVIDGQGESGSVLLRGK